MAIYNLSSISQDAEEKKKKEDAKKAAEEKRKQKDVGTYKWYPTPLKKSCFFP